jgi:Hexameric tyrosine-coordinated heme protein (HTHP)
MTLQDLIVMPLYRLEAPEWSRLETSPADRALDARLDAALADTFPASDPVAITVTREDKMMADPWLLTLKTDTPQLGFDLAMKMSRMGVKVTQPSDDIRKQLRAAYDHDSAQLIATSQVIAINFQTVAAANAYWR